MHLKSLKLANHNLTGTIPTELATITGLQSLDLSGNLLSGTIPLAFMLMKSLTRISLGRNDLTGTIPTEVQLFSGTYLALDTNSLTGSIPSEVFSATNLTILVLSENKVSLPPSCPGDSLEWAITLFAANSLICLRYSA